LPYVLLGQFQFFASVVEVAFHHPCTSPGLPCLNRQSDGIDRHEIGALCNAEFHLDLVVVAPGATRVGGVAAVATLDEAGALDAVIITDLAKPQVAFDALKARMAPERILTPRLLRITRGNGKA
jgi:hypothetical protein